MNRPHSNLRLNLKTKSFEEKIVEFCYKSDLLEEIDKLTYSYENELSFLKLKKDRNFRRIK